MTDEELGKKLCQLRESRQMTQRDLAQRLFVSNKTISKWECGKGVPALAFLIRYAEIFDVSLDELAGVASSAEEAARAAENQAEERCTKKTRIGKRLLFSAWALGYLPALIGAFALPFLPETTPAHINGQGVVDRWGSSAETAIMGLVLSLTALIILGFIYKIFPNAVREISRDYGGSAYVTMGAAALFMPFLFAGIVVGKVVTDCVGGFGAGYPVPPFDTMAYGAVIIGAVTLILGIFMPITKPNALMGVRITTTMNSAENWRRTHRLCGGLMQICGLIAVTVGTFAPGVAAMPTALVLLLTGCIVPIVFSLRLSKKGI